MELKECPFCGGKAKFIRQLYVTYNWIKGIECKECRHNIYFFENCHNVSSHIETSKKQKEMLAKCWNRRCIKA